MDIELMRTFVEAVRHGSFSQAARAMAISQPGISRRISRLEKEVGVTLLDRDGAHFTPTRHGLLFLRFAENVLAEYDAFRRSVAGHDRVQGSIQIAASSTPGECLLPSLLERFAKQYPDVTTTLAVMDSDTVEDCVQERHCDIGFIGRPAANRMLRDIEFAQDEILLAVSKSHRLAGQDPVPLDDLVGERFIGRQSGSGTRASLEALLADAGLALPRHSVFMEVNSARSQLSAIAAGHGIGFLSRLAIDTPLRAKVSLVRIREMRFHRSLHMILLPGGNSPQVDALVQFVQAAFATAK